MPAVPSPRFARIQSSSLHRGPLGDLTSAPRWRRICPFGYTCDLDDQPPESPLSPDVGLRPGCGEASPVAWRKALRLSLYGHPDSTRKQSSSSPKLESDPGMSFRFSQQAHEGAPTHPDSSLLRPWATGGRDCCHASVRLGAGRLRVQPKQQSRNVLCFQKDGRRGLCHAPGFEPRPTEQHGAHSSLGDAASGAAPGGRCFSAGLPRSPQTIQGLYGGPPPQTEAGVARSRVSGISSKRWLR